MTTNIIPNMPSVSQPLVDKNGQITAAWQQLLLNIWTNLQIINTTANSVAAAQATAQDNAVLLQKVVP